MKKRKGLVVLLVLLMLIMTSGVSFAVGLRPVDWGWNMDKVYTAEMKYNIGEGKVYEDAIEFYDYIEYYENVNTNRVEPEGVQYYIYYEFNDEDELVRIKLLQAYTESAYYEDYLLLVDKLIYKGYADEDIEDIRKWKNKKYKVDNAPKDEEDWENNTDFNYKRYDKAVRLNHVKFATEMENKNTYSEVTLENIKGTIYLISTFVDKESELYDEEYKDN